MPARGRLSGRPALRFGPLVKAGAPVARKPNYGFEKRQKEIAKQKKREEKALKKLERTTAEGGELPAEEPPAEEQV
jgi:hypothetical protein